MSISVWFRVIRIKFLLASVIAVSLGLVISYWQTKTLDVLSGAITMGGVIALHASVDLLNDYWAYKRGIDTITKRTKFSGGTGVLPEGLLKPSTVYRAGMICLVLGSLAGAYFVILHGWIIAVILGFAARRARGSVSPPPFGDADHNHCRHHGDDLLSHRWSSPWTL